MIPSRNGCSHARGLFPKPFIAIICAACSSSSIASRNLATTVFSIRKPLSMNLVTLSAMVSRKSNPHGTCGLICCVVPMRDKMLSHVVRVGNPTSAQAGGYRSLPRCIAPLLPDPGKCWQRLGRMGRMIPKPRDLAEGQVDIPMT